MKIICLYYLHMQMPVSYSSASLIWAHSIKVFRQNMKAFYTLVLIQTFQISYHSYSFETTVTRDFTAWGVSLGGAYWAA